MRNYEIRLIPKKDAQGKTYWTAFFPAIEGCVGGGDTEEEAVKEAKENLEVLFDYLQSEGSAIPQEFEENCYSGKIALRTSKTTHKKLAQIADEEGISVNSLINCAIENYLGKIDYSQEIDKKIEEIRETSSQSLSIQQANYLVSAFLVKNSKDLATYTINN